MRKLTLLLPLVAATAFAATSLQTLGARSAHHQLRLERQPSPEAVVYNIVVEDVDTGAVLLRSHIDSKPGTPVDVTHGLGTKQVHVHLADTAHFFTATVDVIDGNKTIDEFRTWWQLEPRDVNSAETTSQGNDAPEVLRIGGDVKAPVIIRRVEPVYTEIARLNRVTGIVIVQALIGKDGRVHDAAVLKPLPDGLSQAAIDAVRQWEFRPATLAGEPVAVRFNLTVNFHLK